MAARDAKSVVFACLALSIICSELEASAQTLNFGISSEFANGFGAGLELGDRHRLTLGTGFAFVSGRHYERGSYVELWPGAGLGYRLYGSSGWFTGATLAANRVWFQTSAAEPSDEWHFAALVDVGHRWRWTSNPEWNTRLGLSGGTMLFGRAGSWVPAAGLTLSVGRDF